MQRGYANSRWGGVQEEWGDNHKERKNDCKEWGQWSKKGNLCVCPVTKALWAFTRKRILCTRIDFFFTIAHYKKNLEGGQAIVSYHLGCHWGVLNPVYKCYHKKLHAGLRCNMRVENKLHERFKGEKGATVAQNQSYTSKVVWQEVSDIHLPRFYIQLHEKISWNWYLVAVN